MFAHRIFSRAFTVRKWILIISRLTDQTILCCFRALSELKIVSEIWTRAPAVDFLFWNPNRNFERKEVLSKNVPSLLTWQRLKNVFVYGKNEIGLKLATFSEGPFIWSGITLLVLKEIGNTTSLNDKFTNLEIGWVTCLQIIFKSLPGMWFISQCVFLNSIE